MAIISREKLFAKLSDFSYRAMAQGTELCRAKRHAYVEVVHWLYQVMQHADSDLHRILGFFGIPRDVLLKDLHQALSRLPVRGTSGIDFSLQLEELVERGWLCGALQYDEPRIRTAHLLLGALSTPVLHNCLLAISPGFARIEAAVLSERLQEILGSSPENETRVTAYATDLDNGHDTAVARFTCDLTAAARNGKLDPVCGRTREIRLLMDILMRRRQNNPLLAGEAGVGKTAVVEGLALMIAAGEVPPSLQDARILALDITLMLAGAGVKGEFEQRLHQLIEEIQAASTPTLLFIDEVHTLVGAGGQAGTADAANLLKPMLARGALRTIGATTWREYKKYIEKDPALKRRFQVVRIEEPEPEAALSMVRSAVAALESHHCVRIQASALEAAVRLSHRYLPERQLPDKAMSLLDTACAGARLHQVTPPTALLELRERVACLSSGLHLSQQEEEEESRGKTSLDDLRGQLKAATDALVSQEAEWLSQAQLEQEVLVNGEHVAEVLQSWTGIPLTTLRQDAIASLMNLETHLAGRIFGQPQAMKAIAKRVQTAHAGLDQPEKPVGVFLLAGPSGVGKTETALALAELLYGGEQQLITINMSEYQEAHSVALLKGAPPGYVGYGEGGVLTEAVRRRPHSVVLLDEIEKAHSDVHELFFQVFDKGRMEDAEGNLIDFRNTLILMTSNVGSALISQHAEREDAGEALHEALQAELLRVFPAAFIGRLIAVPFLPLDEPMLKAIILERLACISERVLQRYQIAMSYEAELVDDLVRRCRESSSGGRRIDELLTQDLLPTLSLHLLAQQRDNVAISACRLKVENDRIVVDSISVDKKS
ncbi:AAA domain-containing protein [Pantoea sp. LS15]|uniref:AAA family ATPase n=1 Tax=Enterobacterales TaxID=91347 RepID=UPI000E0F168A|nr:MULTISPECIES: AAA family ATPase [Enterobacterales]NJQ21799.1 AAA domain-containing protein [Pantoea sp. LS15]NKF48395.1 AAA domain-containing protein [Pantoea sp. LS15]RDK12953.1 AAA family ATPase [Enterobacter sp. 9-2]